MAPEITKNISEIISTCREMQVKSLYVFGSGARDEDYTSKSDLDFLVTLKKDGNGLPASGYDYFDLLFALEKITGKKVDLVQEEGIRNRFFLQSILKDREKIYEA